MAFKTTAFKGERVLETDGHLDFDDRSPAWS